MLDEDDSGDRRPHPRVSRPTLALGRHSRAEAATHYDTTGMDLDLNVAMRHATRETVDFQQEQFGLSPADAYSLARIAVDFRVAEAVDSVQMIYGMIPKNLFKT